MRLLCSCLLACLSLLAQVPHPSEVQERRLANGARLLVVERKGLTAFHATLAFRGGRVEEPGAFAGATDILAGALYGATWPEDVAPGAGSGELEGLLKQEEGLLESLRLERLRLRRSPSPGTQAASLEASLQALQAKLQAATSSAAIADLYTARGGRQWAEATADALMAHTELPQEAFAFWCQTEAQRLRLLHLSHFAQVRAQFLNHLRLQGIQGSALLRGTALSGHPYGRDLSEYGPSIEALRWSELRGYARQALRPDQLTIIVVGGMSLERVQALVEQSLGALPPVTEVDPAILPEVPSDLGDRRVQATLGGTAQVLAGWRIPPRAHSDHLALRMIVQLLAGGKASRLPTRLIAQKGLVSQVEMRLDEPGGRFPGLLAVTLTAAPGHALPELEAALHSEILRFEQEPLPREEWSRALAQLEADHIRLLDDPAALALALAEAWTQGGDWRLMDLDMQRLRTLTPEDVQVAARRWLKPTHRTTVALEPSGNLIQDPIEAEMTQVLTALAARRIEDPAQRERLVAEGLRQLRMLNGEERTRTLKLLADQLKPEKR